MSAVYYCVSIFGADGQVVDYSEQLTREAAENELRCAGGNGRIVEVEDDYDERKAADYAENPAEW